MKASCPELRRSPAYWLLTSRDGVHEVFLTFSGEEIGGGAGTLPVFSGEREAGKFVTLSPFDEERWRARKATAGELISILYGPCERVGRISLDPAGFTGLREGVSSRDCLSPVRFVDMLLGRDRHWFEENRRGALPSGGPRVALREY